MTRLAYTVIATLPNQGVADEYVSWLTDGHIDAVIGGGAHSAMIVRLDPPATSASTPPSSSRAEVQVEVRYIFSTRDDFDRYVKLTAPGLRVEGLQRFGPERGVRFERRTGAVV